MVEDKQAFVSFILCLFLAVVLNCQLIKRKTKNDVCFLMTLYLLHWNLAIIRFILRDCFFYDVGR